MFQNYSESQCIYLQMYHLMLLYVYKVILNLNADRGAFIKNPRTVISIVSAEFWRELSVNKELIFYGKGTYQVKLLSK